METGGRLPNVSLRDAYTKIAGITIFISALTGRAETAAE